MADKYQTASLVCPRYSCEKRGTHYRCYSSEGLHRFQVCKIFKKERNQKRISRLERKV